MTARITTDVDEAADVLLAGGIVGMPTETVYGLAAIAMNENAVHRVFDTKGRPRHHPLIVHLSPESDIHRWGVFNDDAKRLADEFWPGPLTLLVPRTSLVPDWVTGGRETVAIRVPSHPITQQFLRKVNDGVVAPSANRFGKVSPTTAQHVAADLGDDVDIILDGGPCSVGVESTIVECTGTCQVLRPGEISETEVARVVGHELNDESGPSRAPGMLASHYAPEAKVVLVDSFASATKMQSELGGDTTTRILHFDDNSVYAERLYEELRNADSENIQVVIAVLASEQGIGKAVNDRLAKAAAQR